MFIFKRKPKKVPRNDVLIDVETGIIQIDDTTLYPGYTLTEFEKSPLCSNVSYEMINPPYKSYYIGKHIIGKYEFWIVLYFYEDALWRIDIGIDNGITEWSEWTEELELKRKSEHDRILKSYGLPHWSTFAWGEIQSLYDPRTPESSILITYNNKPRPY